MSFIYNRQPTSQAKRQCIIGSLNLAALVRGRSSAAVVLCVEMCEKFNPAPSAVSGSRRPESV